MSKYKGENSQKLLYTSLWGIFSFLIFRVTIGRDIPVPPNKMAGLENPAYRLIYINRDCFASLAMTNYYCLNTVLSYSV